ncbi:hypothetical protein ALI22I_23295 [Saccharothrix sp. ALI-22-I]|uniref:hypothetical protein n=1 Tax=Saccharothrix sp. ALI-22-I TaxID=1933778 RepID=UPI00097BB02F|nr:hypothetical protein [Saccharothrix sp. ALI-22-I]ONI87350.1 hypothetical protein ALI22I_23295 [Saccharothrix sp. ALI-22-I]
MSTATETSPAPRCANDDSYAIAVLLHDNGLLGAMLCDGCVQCTDTRCTDLGSIMDAEYDEPWCAHHAAQFTGEEAVRGPAIVPIGSAKHLKALAEQPGGPQ